MARAARGLAGELRGQIDRAAEAGAWSLALVAALAVGREGLETALFLWAATETATGATTAATVPAWQPLTGAALGLATAVVLGYLLYRGAREDQPEQVLHLDRRLPDRDRGRRARLRHPRPAGGRRPAGPQQPRLRRLAARSTKAAGTARSSRASSTSRAQTTWLQAIAWVLYLSITMTVFVLGVRRRSRPAAASASAPSPDKQPV